MTHIAVVWDVVAIWSNSLIHRDYFYMLAIKALMNCLYCWDGDVHLATFGETVFGSCSENLRGLGVGVSMVA